MVMTFNNLVTEIANYLDRNDTETLNRIPNFIYQAEQLLCRQCENLGTERYIVGNFINGQSVYPKPGRWRRNLTFNYGTGTGNNTRNQVYLRKYEYVRAYWPDSTQTGLPLYYSDYGYNNILIAPTPNGTYPFEWAYLELPEPLSLAVQTNWFTNYAPDLLLVACLLQAMSFLKNDERIPMWKQQYAEGVESIKAQDKERLVDRTTNVRAD